MSDDFLIFMMWRSQDSNAKKNTTSSKGGSSWISGSGGSSGRGSGSNEVVSDKVMI